MSRRLEFHDILKNIPGVKKAYFQPPESVNLVYPCIVYELNNMDIQFADNIPYSVRDSYTVTLIDPNPDSVIRYELSKMPLCRFDRFYTADNLNHYVFTIYY